MTLDLFAVSPSRMCARTGQGVRRLHARRESPCRENFYVQPEAPNPVLSADVALSLIRRHEPSAQAVTESRQIGR